MLRQIGIAAIASILVGGCAARNPPAPLLTATGRPEVTIKSAKPGDIASELATACVDALQGSVAKADKDQVICSGLKPVGFGESMWIALNEPEVGGRATDEAKFTLLETDDGVRVLGARTVTTYNGFGAQLASAPVKTFDRQLQDVLESVAKIAGAKTEKSSADLKATAAK